jgi:hypothetical protein
MSTTTVALPSPEVELPAVSQVLAGAVELRTERYGCAEAANDASTRRAAPLTADGPGGLIPNLSISAWYAISGTAMA